MPTATTQLFKAIVFLFFVLQIFSQQVSVGGRNKNKNKIHSDHFNSIGKLENGPNEFYFTN